MTNSLRIPNSPVFADGDLYVSDRLCEFQRGLAIGLAIMNAAYGLPCVRETLRDDERKQSAQVDLRPLSHIEQER